MVTAYYYYFHLKTSPQQCNENRDSGNSLATRAAQYQFFFIDSIAITLRAEYKPRVLGWTWFACAAQEFSAHRMGASWDITKLKSNNNNPAPASPAKHKADVGLSV